MANTKLNILLACEESQAVCIELRALGHNAFYCDLQECSGGHPEWHINGDALKLINGNCSFTTQDGARHVQKGKWDMIVAFPPCTHLAVSGARHFDKKREDGRQRFGVWFFCQFLEADCDRIAIENPIGVISGDYVKQFFPDLAEKYGLPRKPSQIIQPWMWGDNFSKSTCLWLKNLPCLEAEVTEAPEMEYFEWTDKNGRKKRQPKWYLDALKTGEAGKVRSKTFGGIARAMSTQWTSESALNYKCDFGTCTETKSKDEDTESGWLFDFS